MTAVHLGDVHPALDAPEPTATKLGRQWGAGIDWQGIEETLSDQPEPEVAPGAEQDQGTLKRLPHRRDGRGGGRL